MTIEWGHCRLVTDDEDIPRRSIRVSPGEERRAVSVLVDQMDRLRRAEDHARQIGLAFRRAVREVTECQRDLAEAAGRLQRFPGPGRPRPQGSV